MDFIHYIVFFAVGLAFAGLLCMGWWYSTRGVTTTTPDGKERDDPEKAMIFYSVNKFLTKTERIKIYYEGDHLHNLAGKIKGIFPDLYKASAATIRFPEKWIDTESSYLLQWVDAIPKIEESFFCKGSIDQHGVLKFWNEYDEPVYSKFIRKPLVGCYKCYASFWGTVFFWPYAWLASACGYIELSQALVPIWIAFCFCLVPVNIYLEKVTK